jgi:hypothetical protein
MEKLKKAKITRKKKVKVDPVEKIEVQFWEKKDYLSEILQQTGVHYAFLSADNKQCHPWVKCRDFLNDALRSQITGNSDEIYGFMFDPKINPKIDLDKMRILVKRDTPLDAPGSTEEIMNSALSIIHCVEVTGGIETLTELHRIANDENVYLFEGSADWVESTFMISLYTFLIRLGAKQIIVNNKEDLDAALDKLCKETVADHDISYLKSTRDYIYKMVEKRKELRYVNGESKKLFDGKSISTFHNYSGIVALCNEAKKKKEKKPASGGLEDLSAIAVNIV